MPMLNWFEDKEHDDGDSIGFFMDATPFDYNPDCPKCGKTTGYWEGQIGEERHTGKPIYAAYFFCSDCKIKTATEEL